MKGRDGFWQADKKLKVPQVDDSHVGFSYSAYCYLVARFRDVGCSTIYLCEYGNSLD
jgi:hypothetical protein